MRDEHRETDGYKPSGYKSAECAIRFSRRRDFAGSHQGRRGPCVKIRQAQMRLLDRFASHHCVNRA